MTSVAIGDKIPGKDADDKREVIDKPAAPLQKRGIWKKPVHGLGRAVGWG